MKRLLLLLFIITILCTGCSEQINKVNQKKHIPDSIKNITSTMKNTKDSPLNISDDEYYLLNQTNWYEITSDVWVINKQKEVLRLFKDSSIYTNNFKIQKDTPFVINIPDYTTSLPTKSYSYKTGVYHPATDTFLIEPVFDTINPLNNNMYHCYKDNTMYLYDNKGNVIIGPLDSYVYRIDLIDSNIWLSNTDNYEVKIYDLEMNFIKELELNNTIYNNYGDGFAYTDYKLGNNTFSVVMYDSYGNVILNKEILLDSINSQINGLLHDGTIEHIHANNSKQLIQVTIGSYNLIIDFNYKLIDYIDKTNWEYGYIYVEDNMYTKFYDFEHRECYYTDGRKLTDKEGNSFTDTLGSNHVYRMYDNQILVFNLQTQEEFEFYTNDLVSPFIVSLKEDFFIIRDGNEPFTTKLYHKDKLIHAYTGYTPWDYNTEQGYIQFYSDYDEFSQTGLSYIIDFNGNEIYKSTYHEQILNIDDNYLTVLRGNYFGLIDYNGEFVYKMLNPALMND